MSALLLGVGGALVAPTAAHAQGPIGYTAGDATLGTGTASQHLTFAMIDAGRSGDHGTVSYTNAAAGVAYDASVMGVVARDGTARFAYQIPSSAPPSVRDLIIVWRLKDRSPDRAGFSVAASRSQALSMVENGFTPTNSYIVTKGGLKAASTSLHRLQGYALGNPALGTGTQPRQHLAFVALDYSTKPDKGVAFYENLTTPVSYQASTTTVRVSGHQARFAYRIPAGTGSGLGGTVVAWKVKDNAPDTAGFAVAPSMTKAASMVNQGFTPTNSYGVTAGDIAVVQRLSGHATGGVWFGPSGQRQRMTLAVFDYAWGRDQGTVQYWNLSQGLTYKAQVRDVRVLPKEAYFDYVIPTGSLKGTIVVWKVVDNGSPGAGHDTAGFSVAASPASARSMVEHGFTPTNSYPVTHGNLTVHLP